MVESWGIGRVLGIWSCCGFLGFMKFDRGAGGVFMVEIASLIQRQGGVVMFDMGS